MGKFILSCLITASLLNSPNAKAEILKVATWNVEWLLTQKDLKKTTIPNNVILRNTKDFKRLLTYIHKLNADIIALQEVGSIETLQEIIPKEQYLFFISDDLIAQHTAIAIRKNPNYSIERHVDVSALSHIEHTHILRSGLDITIHTKKDSLRLLVVHLKSGCQSYLLNSRKMDCIILKQQIPFLQEWIQARIKEQQAFIILGDFNRNISVNDDFFKSLSPSSPLTIPTAKFATPCWGGGYFIDGFILDPKASNWIINGSLRVMTYTEKDNDSQKLLSDHCPVSIKIALP